MENFVVAVFNLEVWSLPFRYEEKHRTWQRNI